MCLHNEQAVLEAEEQRGRFAATAADLKLALSGLQASRGCRGKHSSREGLCKCCTVPFAAATAAARR